MKINSISFGRGIYGSRIEEDTYFANLERQARRSNYPIGGGKVERYAWECEHGWHDDSYQSGSSSSSNSGSSSSLKRRAKCINSDTKSSFICPCCRPSTRSTRYINPDTGRPYRCSDN